MHVFGSGSVAGDGGEWKTGLGLGFTNPVGTRGVLDVCFSCGGCCCCLKRLQFSDLFTDLPVPPQAAGVDRTF